MGESKELYNEVGSRKRDLVVTNTREYSKLLKNYISVVYVFGNVFVLQITT